MKYISNLLLILTIFFVASCTGKYKPEKLSMTQREVFSLLPKNPQFVMYMNFKSMRTTDFWKNNISDSILNAENNLGSILNNFKTATGASISEGLDEIFFANTWMGENAIILKGSFDKDKINTSLSADTAFIKNTKNNFTINTNTRSNMSFFLKDNYTICSSNYPSQIDYMMSVSDTSNSGLLENAELMKAIDAVMYKENAFIVSNEKMFIRGIFANLIDSKKGKKLSNEDLSTDSLLNSPADSLKKTDDMVMNRIYEKVNSLSLNLKMKDKIHLNLQMECADENSAIEVKKLFSSIIGIAKLTSAAKKDEKSSAFEKVLNLISVEIYENIVLLSVEITDENIKDFREGNTLLNQK